MLQHFTKSFIKFPGDLASKNSRTKKEALGSIEGWVLESHCLYESLLETADLFIQADFDSLDDATANHAVLLLLIGKLRD